MRRVGRDAEGAEGGEGMRGVQRGPWLRTIFMHVVAATSSTIVTASTSPAGSLASACHCYAIVQQRTCNTFAIVVGLTSV